MATISDNLENLIYVKQSIKSAIEGKGQDLTSVPFTEYAEQIDNIQTKENLDYELTEQENLLQSLENTINNLPDKDVDLSEATATADDVLEGKIAFGKDGKIVGTYKDILKQVIESKTSCQYFFSNCSLESLPDLTKYDFSRVNNMSYMFSNCNASNINVSGMNTSNVNNMSYMFSNCTNLSEVDVSDFNTSSATNLSGLFSGCQKLEKVIGLQNFDTSKVTSMSFLFSVCYKLKEFDLSNFDTKSVTSFYGMFQTCEEVTTIDLRSFNYDKVTNVSMMFSNCEKLENILGEIDLFKVTNNSNLISYCYNLKNITLKNIKKSILLGTNSYGHLLTNETLINTIQELWDLTGSTGQTLSLSKISKENIANIYVKLIEVTDEMRAEDAHIDNKKPCVVCESTDDGAMTITEYAISKNWSIA